MLSLFVCNASDAFLAKIGCLRITVIVNTADAFRVDADAMGCIAGNTSDSILLNRQVSYDQILGIEASDTVLLETSCLSLSFQVYTSDPFLINIQLSGEQGFGREVAYTLRLDGQMFR